ncbi:MAG: hypothetical protein J0H57_22810, partial [Rhodospirillales bacterium]|nr:hypothetical protein [Rhodospirillales bacterium]
MPREKPPVNPEREPASRETRRAERRAEMEAAFRRGQRLETLGRVVAGVAHDFRNAVQAQIGGAELAQQA